MVDISSMSRRALENLASRGQSASKRAGTFVRERKENMYEFVGAAFLMPVVKNFTPQVPMLGGIDIDLKLKVALVSYIASEFTSGDLSDAFHGAAVGAVGAYAWDQKTLFGGLFGTG